MSRHLSKRSSKFSPEEDEALKALVLKHGETNWEKISSLLKTRNPRQCRDRWFCYVSPNINRAPFTEEEDQKLIDLVKKLGYHWVQITSFFEGRTDNQIKNRYNLLKRKKSSSSSEDKKKNEEQIEKISEDTETSEVTFVGKSDNIDQLISNIIETSINYFSTDTASLFL